MEARSRSQVIPLLAGRGIRWSKPTEMRSIIQDLLVTGSALPSVEAAGWVRTRRDSKSFSFLEINDGSCLGSLQVVVDHQVSGAEQLQDMTTGASVRVAGELVASQGGGQSWGFAGERSSLIGLCSGRFSVAKERTHSRVFAFDRSSPP